jgi:hypothetical protein
VSANTSGRSRRRKERANVKKRLKGVYLRSPELSSKDIRVTNISELGLGIETSGIEHAPASGADVEVRLLVGKTAAPVRVRVVHMSAEITGIEFLEPSDLIRGAIRAYFEPEIVGAAMRPVDGKKGAAGQLLFEDPEANTLSLTVASGRLSAFSVGILGNSVEWKEGGPVQLIQNGRTEPLGDFMRNQLVKFAQSADALSPELQQELEAILLLNASPVQP